MEKEMTSPLTPAEIETLRKIVNGELDREVDYAAIIAANKILDRLSPPAPEVDEATVWTEKVFNKAGYFFSPAHSKVAEAAGVLRELIASKDAEIERLRKFLIEIEQMHDDATVGAARHVARLALKAAERNTAEDFGSGVAEPMRKPGLSEADAHIEIQRLAYKTGYNEGYSDASGGLVDRDAAEEGWGQYLENIEALTEVGHNNHLNAARTLERNTAEPDDILSIRAERALGNIRSPKAPATDTTPEVVEVTQADKARELVRKYYPEMRPDYSGRRVQIAIEAEARGRREALEEAFKRLNGSHTPLDELKRMMTGGR